MKKVREKGEKPQKDESLNGGIFSYFFLSLLLVFPSGK
jgi:hypothetical protein